MDNYEIGDVACFAERENILDYNQAINQFEKDKIIPGYETCVKEIYKGIGKDYGWSDVSCEIFDKFVETHGEVTIILD